MRLLTLCTFALAAACSQLPTAPSPMPVAHAQTVDLSPAKPPAGPTSFHGMTATTETPIPALAVVYVCETQPRLYGDGQTVIDHYLQPQPCPIVPMP